MFRAHINVMYYLYIKKNSKFFHANVQANASKYILRHAKNSCKSKKKRNFANNKKLDMQTENIY